MADFLESEEGSFAEPTMGQDDLGTAAMSGADFAQGQEFAMASASPSTATLPPEEARDISFLSEVEVTVTVELGRTVMPIRDVLKFRRGSVVELDKLVGQPAELLINNTPMARGEVIVINERFGFRITKFVAPHE